FDNPEVILLTEQVQRMTVVAKHEEPQNKQEKKLNQLYLEAAQREINQFREQKEAKQQTNKHIQEIERVTNRKILEAEIAEDKKAYLYKTISALTETKDAILWKNRDLVKDLKEEYGYATNQVLNLDRKDFEAIQ
ncbi:22152_t:CDS:2, partial [Racocetra persica]